MPEGSTTIIKRLLLYIFEQSDYLKQYGMSEIRHIIIQTDNTLRMC